MIGRHELESILFILMLLSVLGALVSISTSASRAARLFQAAMISFAAIAFYVFNALLKGRR